MAGAGRPRRSATVSAIASSGSATIRSMPRSRIAAASAESIPGVVTIRWTAVIGATRTSACRPNFEWSARRITSEAASIIARFASTSSNSG